MSDSSALPTSPPLLITKLCDELNKIILGHAQLLVESLKATTDSNSPASVNSTFGILLSNIILEAESLLQCENLPDVLITLNTMRSASRLYPAAVGMFHHLQIADGGAVPTAAGYNLHSLLGGQVRSPHRPTYAILLMV